MAKATLQVRRIYETPEPHDGTRVLVDRLWPRGLTKADARLDRWMKELAPSHELRRWYGHDPARASEFADRYAAELDSEAKTSALEELLELAAKGPVTLLTATRDLEHSHAVVLAQRLRAQLATR